MSLVLAWLIFGPGLQILAAFIIGVAGLVFVTLWIRQGQAYAEVRRHATEKPDPSRLLAPWQPEYAPMVGDDE